MSTDERAAAPTGVATAATAGGAAAISAPPPATGAGPSGGTDEVSWGRRLAGSRMALGFLFPALLVLGAMVVYPIGYTTWRSLYNSDGHRFLGLGNYKTIFTSSDTLTSIKNNALWVGLVPVVITAVGLVFAVLTERVRWSTAFKAVVFMPMAVSFLATGIIFRLVYDQDPNRGVANAVVKGVHDIFSSSVGYPGARPRTPNPDGLAAGSGGAMQTGRTVAPGATALLPLLAIKQTGVPRNAKPAGSPTPTPGAVTGTVWFDFTLGGGGSPSVIDPREKGLPGLTVQAVRADGAVAGSATTNDAGQFAITGLPAGSYRLQLPAGDFRTPFTGFEWLGHALVTWSIMGAYVWIWAGFAMVLIAAGLAAIPRDALEAARVDGATEWQVFRRVTIPLLAPVLLVVIVTLVINVLKVFDLVFVIPLSSTQPDANVLALQMWRVSFGGAQDQGLGSAIGVFLFLLVLPAMIFNIRRFRRGD